LTADQVGEPLEEQMRIGQLERLIVKLEFDCLVFVFARLFATVGIVLQGERFRGGLLGYVRENFACLTEPDHVRIICKLG